MRFIKDFSLLGGERYHVIIFESINEIVAGQNIAIIFI